MVEAAALEALDPRTEAVHTPCSSSEKTSQNRQAKLNKRVEGSYQPYKDLLYLLAVLLPITLSSKVLICM
jgi:hypothetical protein